MRGGDVFASVVLMLLLALPRPGVSLARRKCCLNPTNRPIPNPLLQDLSRVDYQAIGHDCGREAFRVTLQDGRQGCVSVGNKSLLDWLRGHKDLCPQIWSGCESL
ncbi:MC148R [Molluscum contagiosum virus subtype 1]|uniref:Chemokine-like protein MC148 n=2 Tax=Molluscum contagiosum virus TaxID=10279 RepID=MC148_MCV1|nr:MC148R [Molluscum contagiosum virus subtype 1]Q98314.1 RecName: Full=Chemokine-like protein MC148 [Molluscum contagiosum virus subtype 1]AZT86330.1 MC148R [Molluscum contagiosum virus]AAB58019.1 putative CC chemokine [Molluscum contagiosum virus subtype 1]AAC55276.1 MC148R [Molluscum contagiosum virus subtype 1]AQY16898.1 MC148 [Molluscum contagiosum virus subtype 1]AQY17256.1 MC148 [Molluscum contagiosum virus subtype 1]